MKTPQHPFVLPEKITVRLEKAETHANAGFFGKLKDFAPVLTGIATLALSIASFIFLESREQEKQEIATAEARQKALAALNEADDPKKEVAAITLAAYGDTALPTIRILLSGSDSKPPMRSFGVLVVQRWMDAGSQSARHHMLCELSSYAKSDSKSLRLGAYKALVEISDQLAPNEDRTVLALLAERFGSTEGAVETDADVAETACRLLNKFGYSETRTALRNIAHSDAIGTALVSYGNVLTQNLSTDSCQLLLADLNSIELKGPTAPLTLQSQLETLKQDTRLKCKK